MRRAERLARLGLAVALALATGSAARADDRPLRDRPTDCRTARIVVAPEVVFPEQQVVHRIEIARGPAVSLIEWLQPARFPGFRAERLPADTRRGPTRGPDEGALLHVEARALFPLRTGALTLPEAVLACRTAEGTRQIRLPPTVLEVHSLPLDDRPPGFDGLVGDVELDARVSRRRLELGETLVLEVAVRGAANVWRAELAPGPEGFGPAFDVFDEPPELVLIPGRELRAQRSWRFELVPRQTGTLALPALSVARFDPADQRYRVERRRLPPIEVRRGDAVRGDVGGGDIDARRESDPAAARPRALPARLLLLGLLSGLALGLVGWAFGRRRRRSGSARMG